MPRLIGIFPNHDHYVSVFGGSGADILGKPRSRLESYNDLDGHLFITKAPSNNSVAETFYVGDEAKVEALKNHPRLLEAIDLLEKMFGLAETK